MKYKTIYLIHALDETTRFLMPFESLYPAGYNIMLPSEESIRKILHDVSLLAPCSLIVFLGHGFSAGLSSPEIPTLGRRPIIDAHNGNDIFTGHDILLLSCRSAEFILHLKTYQNIVGFGNIISSVGEATADMEYSGDFRGLSSEDIDLFNKTFVDAVLQALKLLISETIPFKKLSSYIEFFINKGINSILRDREIANRVQIARLLFEFRDEISFRSRV